MASAADEVLAAARARADALSSGEGARLRELLHADFRWTSHRGDVFDRDAYVDSNTSGKTTWLAQTLVDPVVTVVGDTAVLRCVAVDEVEAAQGSEVFRMRMTQVWVRTDAGWKCLAGHAGPTSFDAHGLVAK